MDYTKYEIQKKDTLESIAKKHKISVNELVDFHNSKASLTHQFFGDNIPFHVEELFVPLIKDEGKENDILADVTHKARYRCEQLNTTKVENNISFHCNTKKEYTLEKDVLANKAKVSLKEYLYKINPENLSLAIEATKDLEFEKENALFQLNKNNEIIEVLNFSQIKNKWDDFKPNLKNSTFYKEIEKINSNAAKDIIIGGGLEFENEQNLRKTYDKSLFYHVVFNDFDAYKTREKNDILKFISQIFVNIPIELELQHSITREDDYFIEYRTVGTLLKNKIDNNILEEQYNQFYKPIIEYGFTEYLYEYRIRRMVEKKTNLIVNAVAFMKEEVKNNYQLITQFDLKQIDY